MSKLYIVAKITVVSGLWDSTRDVIENILGIYKSRAKAEEHCKNIYHTKCIEIKTDLINLGGE